MFTELRKTIAEFIYPEGPRERRGLERRVGIDSLTGLGNKQELEMALPSAELDPNIAVLVFDLNNLGLLNKYEGHKRGDKLIRRAGRGIQILTKQLTGQCRAFRFGGDEFVVLADIAYAKELCDDLRDGFGKHQLGDGNCVSLSGSAGSTFREADAYLQQIKRSHKRQEKED